MNSFTHFIFDMDGTLVDSTAVVEKTWSDFSTEFNLNFNEVIEYAHGRRTAETVCHFLGKTMIAKKVSDMIEAKEVITTEGICAIPGAAEFLANIPVTHWAIVTSASLALCKNRLLAAGLDCPEVIISAEQVKRGKPDPEGYLLAAQKLKISINRAVIFEDAEAGIKAALASKAAALIVIGSNTAGSGQELFRVADFTHLNLELNDSNYSLSVIEKSY